MQFNTLLLHLLFKYILIIVHFDTAITLRHYTKKDIIKFREEVREMFQYAYEGYLKYANGYDELRPLSCDGMDTWGSYSLTLIDALDTLAVMGNYTEFRRVVKILTENINFDKDINVSVFETNIRIVGGLLSAHLMSHRAGIDLEPGWPCNGPLLRLAEDVARRLLPAFDTKTGMPYGTVNLRYGVPAGETSVTCTAGVGTFIVEFGALSRLTGDPIYEEVALNALYSLWKHRSPIGLFGNHIDVQTGRWTAQDAGIGAGVDSYFEYLIKGAIMLNRPDLLEMFHESRKAIDKYMKRDDWYVWINMNKGQVTLPVFQSLEAYWPGVLSLVGEINSAMRTLFNYHSVWRKYGFLPEFYNIATGEASANRENYPLRPELIESTMYLYRATHDPILLEIGVDILRSIQYSAKTSCGYATIKNVRNHRKEDRMESFFLAETTKYLYLLFDENNFLHNDGGEGKLYNTPNGECIIETGSYIFNTEAHPIDAAALNCCYNSQTDIFADFNIEDYYGEKLDKLYTKKEDDKFKCPEKVWVEGVEDISIDIETYSNIPSEDQLKSSEESTGTTQGDVSERPKNEDEENEKNPEKSQTYSNIPSENQLKSSEQNIETTQGETLERPKNKDEENEKNPEKSHSNSNKPSEDQLKSSKECTGATQCDTAERPKNQDEENEKNRQRRQFNGVWNQLVKLLIQESQDENGLKDFTQNYETEIVDLIKFLMKNTKSKEFQKSFWGVLEQGTGDSTEFSKKTETSLMDVYESREKIKLAFEIVDELMIYHQNKSKNFNNIDLNEILDVVLNIISNAKKSDNDSFINFDEMHRDILKIMLNAQQRTERFFYNPGHMLTFFLESNGYESVNKDILKIVLRYAKLAEAQKQSYVPNDTYNSKLNLDYFEHVAHIIAFKKKMHDTLKKLDLLTKEKIRAELENPNDDNAENLISAFIPGHNSEENKVCHNTERSKQVKSKENDDIILIKKNKISESKEFEENSDNDKDIGVGTVESIDMESNISDNLEEDNINDEISKHIKPNPSESDLPKVGTALDEDNNSIFTGFVQSVLKKAFSTKPKFDPQLLLQKIRSQGEYLNYKKNYELFTCKAQSFLQRFAVLGQVLD